MCIECIALYYSPVFRLRDQRNTYYISQLFSYLQKLENYFGFQKLQRYQRKLLKNMNAVECLLNRIQSSSAHMYVDDTQISIHVEPQRDKINKAIRMLNIDQSLVLDWSKNNGLLMNAQKCSLLILGIIRLGVLDL